MQFIKRPLFYLFLLAVLVLCILLYFTPKLLGITGYWHLALQIVFPLLVLVPAGFVVARFVSKEHRKEETSDDFKLTFGYDVAYNANDRAILLGEEVAFSLSDGQQTSYTLQEPITSFGIQFRMIADGVKAFVGLAPALYPPEHSPGMLTSVYSIGLCSDGSLWIGGERTKWIGFATKEIVWIRLESDCVVYTIGTQHHHIFVNFDGLCPCISSDGYACFTMIVGEEDNV